MTKEDIMKLVRDSYDRGQSDLIKSCQETMDIAIKAAMRAERECCARVCENIYTGEEACGDWPTPEMCAAAIRARSDEGQPH